MVKGKVNGNLGFTVSYSMAKDSKNKAAAWTLLSWLTGKAGMTLWMSKGLALPSRTDVKAIGGRAAFLAAGPFSHGWGFPNFSATYTIMNNDLQAVINGSMTTSPDAVRRGEVAEGLDGRSSIPSARRHGRAEGAARPLRRWRPRRRPRRQIPGPAAARSSARACARPAGATRSCCSRWPSSASSSSTRSSTRIYISFFEWGILGKVQGVGTAELPHPLPRPDLPEGDQEHVEYTVVVVPLEMALGLAMALVDQREDPRPGVLPLGASTSRRSSPRPRSPRSRSTSSTPTGC